MLTNAIGDLLPSALGVALSPVPIIAVILMLDTPKARANGAAFAVGWVAGLIVVSAIVLVVAGDADDPDSTASTGVHWLELVLGLLFLAMAARQWRQRPRHGEEAPMPTWMTTIDTFTPTKSLALGAALSAANPKNLALTLAAAASIAQAGLTGGDAAAVAVFVVLGSLTVAGPVLFYILASDRAAGPLTSIKELMAQHNAVIMMVVLLILGAKLIGAGLAGVGD
jgi:hypothetical protein